MVFPRNLDERVSIRLAAPGLKLDLASISAAMQHYRLDKTDPVIAAVAATVEIFTDTGTGSGFIVHPDGLVITGGT